MQIRILMKDYNLDSFQDKDVYTFEEIIKVIEGLESELHTFREEKEDDGKTFEEDPHDRFIDNQLCEEDRL